jgi:hypothetical protein
MANNPKFSPQTKHIAIKYHHFCKHVITQLNPYGFIQIDYCSTDNQIADLFTKPVCDDIFILYAATTNATRLVAMLLVMRECENMKARENIVQLQKQVTTDKLNAQLQN